MAQPDNLNPYEPATVDTPSQRGGLLRIAAAMGVTGFLVGISPTLYMLYICIESLWTVATMEIPKTSIRPMGLAAAMFGLTLMAISLAPVTLIFSWIAKRLGSDDSAKLAVSSIGFIAVPFVLGFITFIIMIIICNYRGIEIGS